RPPPPTLFPYTTLFRSDRDVPSAAGKAVLDAELLERPAEDSLDVLRDLREEVAWVGVVRAVDADPVHHPPAVGVEQPPDELLGLDRKSTRLNSSHVSIS